MLWKGDALNDFIYYFADCDWSHCYNLAYRCHHCRGQPGCSFWRYYRILLDRMVDHQDLPSQRKEGVLTRALSFYIFFLNFKIRENNTLYYGKIIHKEESNNETILERLRRTL